MKNNPNTYSQIYIQLVFAVQRRECLLNPSWETKLYKYITGIIQEKDQFPLAINGHRDHIHILVAIWPTCVISDLVREIKKASTNFVNLNRYTVGKFNWQVGFGAFSYSRWDVEMIKNYIAKQREHHMSKSFKHEYLELLKEFDIPYKPEYLFEWIDEAA